MKQYKVNIAGALPLYLIVEAFSVRQIQEVFSERFGFWISDNQIMEEF